MPRSALSPLASTGSASIVWRPAAGADRARQALRAAAEEASLQLSAMAGRQRMSRLPLILLGLVGLWLIAQSAWAPVKTWYAQTLLERAFTDSRTLGHPVRAWSWAEATPVARIRVPRLGAEVIVLAGEDAAAFGPTLASGEETLEGRGTAVFAGRLDRDFGFLAELRSGDVIEVQTVTGPTLRYRAAEGSAGRDATRPSIAFTARRPAGDELRYVMQAEVDGPTA